MEDRASLPIGIFDSGVGGLTVMRQVVELLPEEKILYLGDTANLPYGEKSPQAVLRYTRENVAFLLEKQIKLLIVACHTASSHALDALTHELSIPVLGVVQPGFELLQKFQRVAVIGTASTIQSGIYQTLARQYAPHLQLQGIACPLFVPFIEEGLFRHRALKAVAEHYLAPLIQQLPDAVLLGCTHYPLIRPILQEVLGPSVQLIEPAHLCAVQAKKILEERGWLNRAGKKSDYQFFATDDLEKFRRLTEIFFGEPIRKIFNRH